MIPELSRGSVEVYESVMPGDETEVVYSNYRAALSRYIQEVEVEFAPLHVEDPPSKDKLDGAIRASLVAMARSGVKGGLAKMAWLSYALTADGYMLEVDDAADLPAAVLHRRLHQSDFYLSEFRRLQENESNKTWLVTLQSPDGKAVVQKPRVFPMWGIEVEHGLDNYQKAKAWYRMRLKERGIVR